MDDTLAHARLLEVLHEIDAWGALYNRRWGKNAPEYLEDHRLDAELRSTYDRVYQRTRLARDIVAAIGEDGLAERIVERGEGQFGSHPFTQARVAIIEAIAILSQREELAEIVGPVGPRLVASELHPVIWGAAAALWDNGHHRQAVQTAASGFEGHLQAIAGPATSGENLAILFSTKEPTAGSPRLRLRDVDPESKTWTSAHEGASALVRGAFMGVRNLVSHHGWADPTPTEALEMLAVLSYVAHLVDRSDVTTAAA